MWITAIGLILFTWLMWKCLKGRATRREPPGPWGLPIVGYVPFLDMERPNLSFMELAKNYGDVFQLRMGSRKVVVVNGQRVTRQFYDKPMDFLSAPKWTTLQMKFAIIDCFIFAPFTLRYWIHKKLLFRAVNRLVTERAHEIEEAVHKVVCMVADEAKKRNRQPFDPEVLCYQSVCAIIFYHTYGRLPNLTDQDVQEALRLHFDSKNASKPASNCDMLPWMRYLPTMWKSLSTFQTLLKQNRNFHDKFAAKSLSKYNDTDRRCFIDFLSREVAQMDKEDKSILKVDEELIKKTSCNVSFFGGVSALGIPLRWFILLAALYPDVQKKVRDEINQKIGKNRQPGLRDAGKLPYTTAVLREMFRYASMAALGTIKSTTCDTELDGYFIPRDTTVMVNLYSANRDGTVFPNPDTFDPQRFLNPDGTLNTETYKVVIDTGLGPRRCGGGELMWVELYTFFATLIQCCHIEQAPGCPLDPTKYCFDVGVDLKPFKVIMY